MKLCAYIFMKYIIIMFVQKEPCLLFSHGPIKCKRLALGSLVGGSREIEAETLSRLLIVAEGPD